MSNSLVDKIPGIKQIKALNKEVKGLQGKVNFSDERIKELQAKVIVAEKIINELQEKIELSQEAINSLQGSNQQLARRIEMEQHCNRELKELLGQYGIKLQKLEEEEKKDKVEAQELIQEFRAEAQELIQKSKVETQELIQKSRVEAKKNLADARYDMELQMQYNLIRSLPPEQYKEALCEWYYSYMGERLDLDKPKNYNEKIQWLKLYDNTPLKTKLSDKYEVREWIKEVIGEEYLIPLLGVWDNFDEIDFDALPNSFVLKATHGSGWNIIVKDKEKFNKGEARRKFRAWLSKNYAYKGFEFHYKDIKPRIIAEQYIENDNDLYDYKFLCLDEKPRYVWLDVQRYSGHRKNIYDMEWNEQPFQVSYPHSDIAFPKPENFEKMKELVDKLCQGFALVRVDLYNINGKIYFGEMTFTSGNGLSKIEPKEYNVMLGDMITLPEKKMFEGKML